MKGAIMTISRLRETPAWFSLAMMPVGGSLVGFYQLYMHDDLRAAVVALLTTNIVNFIYAIFLVVKGVLHSEDGDSAC